MTLAYQEARQIWKAHQLLPDLSNPNCPCPAQRHDGPFHLDDLARKSKTKDEDRRARYRGFRDAAHFLELAADRGPNADVSREYRIIFMGDPLDTLPFPVITDAA